MFLYKKAVFPLFSIKKSKISASKISHFSKKYSMHIVDRVGGGDSFGGGLIYSLLTEKTLII